MQQSTGYEIDDGVGQSMRLWADLIPAPSLALSSDGSVLWSNASAKSLFMTKCGRPDLFGKSSHSSEWWQALFCDLENSMCFGVLVQKYVTAADGSVKRLEFSSNGLLTRSENDGSNDSGEKTRGQPPFAQMMVSVRDCTDETIELASKERMASIMSVHPDAILDFSETGDLIQTNPAGDSFVRNLGTVVSNSEDILRLMSAKAAAPILEAIVNPSSSNERIDSEGEIPVRAINGEFLSMPVTVILARPMGKKGGYSLIVRDSTEQRMNEMTISEFAMTDILTGLPNRQWLTKRLAMSMEAADRDGKSCTVCFLDIDEFKTVNDRLGHEVGDHLLKAAGRRILSCLKKGEHIARHGADEFIAIFENTTDAGAQFSAKRISAAISEPFEIDTRDGVVEARLGVSIGLCSYPAQAQTAEELISGADLASGEMKENGKGGIRFFSPDMRLRATRKFEITNKLQRSLARGEMDISWQPKISFSSGQAFGAEGLARWDLEGAPPSEFIGAAERSGIIREITTLALRAAFRANNAAKNIGVPFSPAINLSASDLADPGFTAKIARIMREEGGHAKGIELEITESMVVSKPHEAKVLLQNLRGLGFSIALDDFGTGHSSLSLLRLLPINTLKIDQSFTKHIGHGDKKSEALVQAIISMAAALDLDTCAEGVETQEQAEMLQKMGCTSGQGWLFAKSMPLQDVLKWTLEKHRNPFSFGMTGIVGPVGLPTHPSSNLASNNLLLRRSTDLPDADLK